MQRIYHIDTCILVSLLNSRDPHHRMYNHLFIRHNKYCLFRITHIALGETIHILMNNNIDLSLDELSSKLQYYNIQIRSMPDFNSLREIINTIKEYDDRLDYNDILIVAAAIADNESIGLITMDSDMIGNHAIDEAARKHSEKRFIVSDNPFKRRRGR